MSVNVHFYPCTDDKLFNEWLYEQKELHPVRSGKLVPNWFKNTKHVFTTQHNHPEATVKKCIPFVEALTEGFIIRAHMDYTLKFNPETNEANVRVNDAEVHLPVQNHDFMQTGDMLLDIPCSIQNVFKWLNPWTVRTPRGYSCLFTHPLNNGIKSLQFFSGIVDTDSYNKAPTNLPFYVKRGFNEFEIKQGDPLVQVIPFKRQKYRGVVSKPTEKTLQSYLKARFDLHTHHWEAYKNKFWHKKRDK